MVSSTLRFASELNQSAQRVRLHQIELLEHDSHTFLEVGIGCVLGFKISEESVHLELEMSLRFVIGSLNDSFDEIHEVVGKVVFVQIDHGDTFARVAVLLDDGVQAGVLLEALILTAISHSLDISDEAAAAHLCGADAVARVQVSALEFQQFRTL